MENFDIKQVICENFRTETEKNGDTASLFLFGHLDLPNPDEFLAPFLRAFHNKLIDANIKKVILDIKNLTFINSSSVKVFLNWLMHNVKPMEENLRYRVELAYNKDSVWQFSAFKPLSIFVSDCFFI